MELKPNRRRVLQTDGTADCAPEGGAIQSSVGRIRFQAEIDRHELSVGVLCIGFEGFSLRWQTLTASAKTFAGPCRQPREEH